MNEGRAARLVTLSHRILKAAHDPISVLIGYTKWLPFGLAIIQGGKGILAALAIYKEEVVFLVFTLDFLSIANVYHFLL